MGPSRRWPKTGSTLLPRYVEGGGPPLDEYDPLTAGQATSAVEDRDETEAFLNSEIENFVTVLGPVGRLPLYRKNYPKKKIDRLDLPDFDFRTLQAIFAKFASGDPGGLRIRSTLVSNAVLPLVKKWYVEVRKEWQEMERTFFLRENTWLAQNHMTPAEWTRKNMVKAAMHALQHGEQAVEVVDSPYPCVGICALYAAKLYKTCKLIREAQWHDDEMPYRAQYVCVWILLQVYADIKDGGDESFFGQLLGSVLAEPMHHAVRAKWESRLLPLSEQHEQSLQQEQNLQHEVSAPADDRDDRAGVIFNGQGAAEHTAPFTDEESMALLLAYRDLHKAAKQLAPKNGVPKDGALDVSWEAIAEVIPGRLPSECRRAFEELRAESKNKLSGPDVSAPKMPGNARVLDTSGCGAQAVREKDTTSEHPSNVTIQPSAHSGVPDGEIPPQESQHGAAMKTSNMSMATTCDGDAALAKMSQAHAQVEEEVSQLRARVGELEGAISGQQEVIMATEAKEAQLASALRRIAELESAAKEQKRVAAGEATDVEHRNAQKVAALEQQIADIERNNAEKVAVLEQQAADVEKTRRAEAGSLRRDIEHSRGAYDRMAAESNAQKCKIKSLEEDCKAFGEGEEGWAKRAKKAEAELHAINDWVPQSTATLKDVVIPPWELSRHKW